MEMPQPSKCAIKRGRGVIVFVYMLHLRNLFLMYNFLEGFSYIQSLFQVNMGYLQAPYFCNTCCKVSGCGLMFGIY